MARHRLARGAELRYGRGPESIVNSRLKLEPKTAALARVAARYATAITPAMRGLIDPSDLLDPIARQFVPTEDEALDARDESPDPIGDHVHSPAEGIVHRYDDRALLKLSHLCPVYCRFCFRREMVGPGRAATLSPEALERAIEYIAATPALWEIILTGGDPLILSPQRIGAVTRRLAAIEHVKVLRWHTRVPVVAPERITAELVAALKADGASTWVALHANHPRELTAPARAAIARLVDAGIPLVSQSVLLRGVNDDPETLEALMRGFVEARVKPYYLHHLDRAPGTAHFRTSIARGQELVLRLHDRASGLCQPSYVLDMPGGYGKAPLGAASVEACHDGYRVRTRTGIHRHYRE
jgi:lysine 2,3-aminomutase